jgi:hypothetical protein
LLLDIILTIGLIPQIFSGLTLTRMMQLTRLSKLLAAMPEMLIIAKAMVCALRSVLFTLLLLIATTYIFAIVCRMVATDVLIEKYFTNVPASMFTLMAHGIFLGRVDEVLFDLKEESAGVFVLFLLFVLVGLSVAFIAVGVLLEVVSIVANGEKDKLIHAFFKKTFVEALGSALTTTDGLSNHSLRGALENPVVAQCLCALQMDQKVLMNTPQLFDGRQYKSVDEFVDELMRFGDTKKGVATYLDILGVRKDIQALRAGGVSEIVNENLG